MGRGYPPEFRRGVLDLLAAGRKEADVARDLGVSDQTIYNSRKEDTIDRGLEAGLTSTELEELAKARHRIAELEAEVAAMKRSQELLKELVPPKGRFDVIAQTASEGHAVKTSCRILSVSESGFYVWRGRPPSARAIRHAWLTNLITQVHLESRGTTGRTEFTPSSR